MRANQSSTQTEPAIERKITSSTTIVLRGTDAVAGTPLFAINWFNTRWAGLYHFYNFLAASSLFRIGGKVFFKGRVIEMLRGDPSLARDHLLIVNYPSADAFLNLVAGRYFQIISVFRMLAVRDFSFVFHRRVNGPSILKEERQIFDESKAYAILLFRSSSPLTECLQALEPVLSEQSIHFSSERSVTMTIEGKNGKSQEMPYVTEKVLLFVADDISTLKQMLTLDQFTQAIAGFHDVFLATIRRTM
ncbi:MAG: hypothetical protein QM501_11760 [Gimesia sp.]